MIINTHTYDRREGWQEGKGLMDIKPMALMSIGWRMCLMVQ